MHLAITIDTEEDNWSNYESKPVLSNISKLLELQQMFDRYGVRPTYLVSYPVATDKESVSILRKIMEDGRCEIGAHIHAWNTPPFEEDKSVKNTMLFNLEKELQYRKLESLHEKIFESFRISPVSFRSGRWGFDRTVAENIHRLGYRVDTSVSPYLNWESYHGPDFSDRSPRPEVLPVGDPSDLDSCLLEVPATIGFLQSNYEFCNACLKTISGSALRHFRLVGILDKLNIVNKVWLSPESDNSDKMIALAESIRKKGYPILNMFFHSPSLTHGLTHFTKTSEEEKELTRRVDQFLQYMERSSIQSITISESLNVCLPKTAAS